MKIFYLSLILALFHPALKAQIDFLPYQEFISGDRAKTLCIGDVNNDGLNEVVVGTRVPGSPGSATVMQVFTQDQQDTLKMSRMYYILNHSRIEGIDIGDVNNDGLQDVVIGYSDSVGIYTQDTSGNLNPNQSMYSGDRVNTLKLGDLNNDGLTDIASGHFNDSIIRVFYQTQGGFSDTTYPSATGPVKEIELGDVNSDGRTDLVYVNFQGVYIFTQRPSGSLNNPVFYPPPNTNNRHAEALAIGNLNTDGAMDIAMTKGGNKPSSHMVFWYQNPSSGQLQTPPHEIPAYDIPEPVEIEDMNCNGKNEIITLHGGWRKLSVYAQDSTGQYGAYQMWSIPYASHYSPQGMDIGDINNDGLKDIAIADYNHGLVILINNSTPSSIQYDTTGYTTATDTSISLVVQDSVYFNMLTTDSVENYLVTKTDSFKVLSTYRVDSVSYDSLSFITTTICGTSTTDTVKSHVNSYYKQLIARDTSLISSSYDTINPYTSVSLYPNPTEDVVYLELPAPLHKHAVEVLIYDAHGSVIDRETLHGRDNKRKLYFGSYADAVYMLRISIAGIVLYRRIAKYRQ